MLKSSAAQTKATGLSHQCNVPSGRSRCFPDLWPQTLLWLWDGLFAFSPLSPLSLLGLIYHLPLWGWLYPPTQNQPHCAMKMPPLWKMLCQWLRVVYSNFCGSAWVLYLGVSFHDACESMTGSPSTSLLSYTLTPPFSSSSGDLFLSFPSDLFFLVSWCSLQCD